MNFIVRRATPFDADAIAQAHVDSIRSIGARFYSRDIIEIWGKPRRGNVYVEAMKRGEVFFVAVLSEAEDEKQVLGFSSHRVENGAHRIAVYVGETATRKGVGSALFSAAESMARRHGASEIKVDASLAAVDFYKSLGFGVVAAGQHAMGHLTMDCVFMRKDLGAF